MSSRSSSSSNSARRRKKDRKEKHRGDKRSKKSKEKKKSKGKSRSKGKERRKKSRERKWQDNGDVPHDPSKPRHLQAYLLPRTAANMIQKVFRGHSVRTWTNRKIREMRVLRKDLTRYIMTQILHDVLEKEFVPDILVEVVTSMSPEVFAPHPAWLRDQLAAAEKITKETVTKLIREVVRETFNDLVNEYLVKERMEQKKKGSKSDQLALYVDLEIVQPVLKPILLTLAREVATRAPVWLLLTTLDSA